MLESHLVLVSVLIFFCGIILSTFGNYFFVSVDIAYIKGQLSEILKSHDIVADMVEKYAKIDLANSQIETDLEGMELRMKLLESKHLNGRHHG